MIAPTGAGYIVRFQLARRRGNQLDHFQIPGIIDPLVSIVLGSKLITLEIRMILAL